MPKKLKRTWFVVADGAHVNFFGLNDAGNGLDRIEEPHLSATSVRIPARELKSDKPGRTVSGGQPHAIEPRHDYHKLEKHKFTVGVAGALEKAYEGKRFDQLVLVAPARSLGELRAVLSEPVRSRVVHELAKDLTRHPPDSLWQHLAPIARKLMGSVA